MYLLTAARMKAGSDTSLISEAGLRERRVRTCASSSRQRKQNGENSDAADPANYVLGRGPLVVSNKGSLSRPIVSDANGALAKDWKSTVAPHRAQGAAGPERVCVDDDGYDRHVIRYLLGRNLIPGRQDDRRSARRQTPLRLYTATIADTRDNRMFQAFHASVARGPGVVRARLARRFGPDLAAAADIRPGLHSSAPLVIALVPVPVAEMILQIGQDCPSPSVVKFAVDIQQIIQN